MVGVTLVVTVLARTAVVFAMSVAVKSGHLYGTSFESLPFVLALILCSLATVGAAISSGDGTVGILIASLAILDVLTVAGFHIALQHYFLKGRELLASFSVNKLGFVTALVWFTVKSTGDVFAFTICYFSHKVSFYVCVSAQFINMLCVHFLMYDTYDCCRSFFGHEEYEEEACEIMIEDYVGKRESVGGVSFNRRFLSFPNMAIRNTVKTVLHGGGMHICHDKTTLSHDQGLLLEKGNDHTVEKERHLEDERPPLTKIEYERLKRSFQGGADRDFRAILFTSCVFPSITSVQRARGTRGILTKSIRHITLRFHDDKETALLRTRIVNLDDDWLYRVRATFIMCIERFVQGFPTLWSPQEEFFAQCDKMVDKCAFNCDVTFCFYLVQAQRSGKFGEFEGHEEIVSQTLSIRINERSPLSLPILTHGPSPPIHSRSPATPFGGFMRQESNPG
jgi:hypothetical protein